MRLDSASATPERSGGQKIRPKKTYFTKLVRSNDFKWLPSSALSNLIQVKLNLTCIQYKYATPVGDNAAPRVALKMIHQNLSARAPHPKKKYLLTKSAGLCLRDSDI